jgi:hypothetical protein
VELSATVSLYCAIAELRTGDKDTWFATLEQKAGMVSEEDRLWMNELKSSWVCQHDGKTLSRTDVHD